MLGGIIQQTKIPLAHLLVLLTAQAGGGGELSKVLPLQMQGPISDPSSHLKEVRCGGTSPGEVEMSSSELDIQAVLLLRKSRPASFSPLPPTHIHTLPSHKCVPAREHVHIYTINTKRSHGQG